MKKIVSIFVTMLMCVLSMNLSAQTLADYTFTTGTDASRWITLTSPTNLITSTGDYAVSGVNDLGFSFMFGNQSYSQFSVNADGNLRFGSTVTGTTYYSTPFGSNLTYNVPFINMLGCDGFLPSTGYVHYQLMGTAPNRIGVVEFATATYSSQSVILRWQVQLYEGSNDIQVVFYSSAPSTAPTASRQQGLATSASDVLLVNASYQSMYYGGSTTDYIASGFWPSINTYYRFSFPGQNSVNNLTVSDVTLSSAVATWNENSDATGYTVYCNGVNQTVTSPTALLTGLSVGTTYTVSVTPLGIAGAEAATETFTTNELQEGCVSFGAEQSVELSSSSLGASASTWYYAPINNFYHYSYTQQIFTPSEIGGAGVIKSISFKYNYSTAMSASNVRLYLAHRSSSTFLSTTDYTPFSDAVLVYTGSLNCSQGWNTFTFDTPFEYNGVDNLVLIAFDNVSGYSGSSYTFNTHNTGANRALYYYSDTYIPDPNNLGSYSGSKYTSASRNDVRFGVQSCDEYRTITCYSPLVSITEQSEMDYTISWAPGYDETQWDVYLTTSAEAPTASTVPTYSGVTSRSMHFDDLLGLTTYYAYVRSNCGEETSEWTAVPAFTTGCGDYVSVPYSENFSETFPECWSSLLYNSTSSLNAVAPYTSSYSSSPASLRLYSGSTDYYAMAVTPQLDPSVNMDELVVRLKMYTTYTTQPLVVGVMTDPTNFSTFSPVETLYVSSTSTWQDKEVLLNSYTGAGHYVAFYTTYSPGTYVYVDNFVVTYAPVPATLPYNTGFEDAVDNANWITSNGTYSNQWYIGNATNNGGSNALYISNDGGVSNNYNTSSSSYVWAYRDVVFTPSAYGYKLSFDWKGYGESSFDYMLVYFGNPSVPSGSSAPSGVTQLDGAGGYNSNYFNYTSSWKHYEYEFPSYDEETTVRFYFYWRNDGSDGTTPPAAVDNFIVERITCKVPEATQIVVSNLNVATNGANAHVSWPSGEETGWDVYLTADPSFVPTASTTPSYTTTDPSVDLTGLEGSTTYYVYVRPSCDGTPMDWSNRRQFSTPCPFATVPYFEGFEDIVANSQETSYPTCWQRDATNTYPYVSSTTPATGSNSLYMYSTASDAYTAYSQPINVSDYSEGELAVYFKTLSTSATNGRLDFGVMTNLDDPTTYSNLLSIYPSDYPTLNTYVNHAVLLQNAYTEPIYLVFKAPVGATNSLYLDDVEVKAAPTCYNQTNFMVSNVASTSAFISFTEPLYGDNNCDFRYAPAGTSDWTTIHFHDRTQYILEGLEPQTEYVAELVPSCDNTQVMTATFKTTCPAYDYTSTGSGTRMAEIGDATTTTSTYYFMPGWYGWHYEAFLYDLSENEGANGLLKSLAFNVQQGSSSTGSTLQIFVKEVPNTFSMSASNTFNQLVEGAQSIYNGSGDYSTTGWKTFTLDNDFTVNSGNNLLVLFKGTGCGTSGGCTKYLYYTSTPNAYWYKHQDGSDPGQNVSGSMSNSYLPNMRFEFAQYACADITGVCLAPNVAVSVEGSNSAHVTWGVGNGESQWEISYKYADSYVWSTPVVINYQDYTLSDLTPGSAYQVRVRSICDENVYSDWSIVDFETICEEITVPYMQDFESSMGTGASYFVDCWNRGTNAPVDLTYTIDDNYGYVYDGNYSLYFNGDDEYYTYAALPYMSDAVQIDNLDVRFWSYKTATNYQIEVGIMTNPNDYSTFELIGSASPSSTYEWEELSVKTAGYRGHGRFLTFRVPAWYYNTMYVDDIRIDYITECDDVTDITVDEITETTAIITWDADDTQAAWEVLVTPAGQPDVTVFSTRLGDPEITGEGVAFSCGTSTVKDADDNTYHTVQIGSQCWLKENIHTTKYADGTEIALGSVSSNTPYRYYPDGNAANVATFGYLYNWAAAMNGASSSDAIPSGVQGVCPTGWHIPSNAEWFQFTDFLSSNDDYVCNGNPEFIARSVAAETQWNNFYYSCVIGYDIATNNATGFTALPAGHFDADYNSYSYFRGNTGFWSSTLKNTNEAYNAYLYYGSAQVNHYESNLLNGSSVRCLKDPVLSTVEVSGLLGDTQYDVYVRVLCGTDDNGFWSLPVSFRTDCPQYMNLPYTENFDDYTTDNTTNSYPDCWTRVASTSYIPYVTSSYKSTPQGSLYLGNYYSYNTIAVAPEIDPSIPMTQLYTTFKLLKPSATYPNVVILGLMTDNADASTFSAIDTLSPKYVGSWEEFEIYFDELENLPAGSFIALKSITPNTSSYYNYIYVDDFVVDYVPACRRPKGIDVTQVTASSALLTFDQFGSPESWNVEYGPAGFERGTGIMVTATSNPFRIYGLNEQTLYDVYAQANCGGGETSMWSDPVQFSTPCLPYTLPFTEDFTGLTSVGATVEGTLPDCWNDLYTGLNHNYAPKVCNATTYLPGTESPYLYIAAGNSADNGESNVAILPLIDDMGAVKVSFDAVADNLNSTLRFGYMDGNNFVTLQTIPVTTTPQSFSFLVCGKTYPLGARFAIQLEYTGTSGSSVTHVGVDNIEISTENMSVMDYDQNVYPVKVYGNQCWMTENLRSEHYADGAAIPGTIAYNNDESTVANYGLLYNWYSAVRVPQGSTTLPTTDAYGRVQGVCPEGWTLPTVNDFNTLLQHVNGAADLKSTAESEYWLGQFGGNNPGAGFNAIPVGYEDNNNFINFLGEAYFWTTTSVTVSIDKALCLPYYCPEAIYKDVDSNYGLNIRCVIAQ